MESLKFLAPTWLSAGIVWKSGYNQILIPSSGGLRQGVIRPQKPREPGCPFLLRAVSSRVGGHLGSFSSLAARGVGMLSQNLLSQAGFWEFAWWPDSGKVLLPPTTIFLFLRQVFWSRMLSVNAPCSPFMGAEMPVGNGA